MFGGDLVGTISSTAELNRPFVGHLRYVTPQLSTIAKMEEFKEELNVVEKYLVHQDSSGVFLKSTALPEEHSSS
ncbi:hypothetical protein EMCRGX_G014614 [Ephydatia muelleri]